MYNIYDATSGRARRQMVLDFKKIKNENIQGVKVDKKTREVEIDLDTLNCPLEDILIKPGVFMSPDEILGSHINNILKIPLKERHETNPPLPDSDLLKVLHYYTSKRLESQNWGLKQAMDGSALLGLGMMVEKWAQDLVDEETAKLFVEQYEDAPEPETYLESSDHEIESEKQEHHSSTPDQSDLEELQLLD